MKLSACGGAGWGAVPGPRGRGEPDPALAPAATSARGLSWSGGQAALFASHSLTISGGADTRDGPWASLLPVALLQASISPHAAT